MPTAIAAHIETTHGVCGGKPRIAGRRVTVQDLAVWHVRLGRSVDEIARDHDLTLGEIYAGLSYYFDHRAAIDRAIAEAAAYVNAMRAEIPSKRPADG